MRRAYILSGGTFNYIAPHLALSAPAFGKVGNTLVWALKEALGYDNDWIVTPLFTKMAHASNSTQHSVMAAAGVKEMITNEDVAKVVKYLVDQNDTKIIVMAVALCDFVPGNLYDPVYDDYQFGKDTHPRLESNKQYDLCLTPAPKILPTIRKERKDIFLVGFKTTAGASPSEQYIKGLTLLKKNSCNLVLANDVKTRLNMVITPEQARYYETNDRNSAIYGLAEMMAKRASLNFTRAVVVPGEPVPWDSELIPNSLRTVVNWCIENKAYKPFLGSTVGHFAVKLNDGTILTSRRKTNFNNLKEVGLVKIEPREEGVVLAYGSKPSVGGQSQRIIFSEHPDVDCIVHFHCPLRGSHNDNLVKGPIPVHAQEPYECGSHECGKNTSEGLKVFETYNGKKPIKAVMLDKHGPNIVFNRNIDPNEVILFIDKHFDLSARTDNLREDEWKDL
jgi:hypothetical protein